MRSTPLYVFAFAASLFSAGFATAQAADGRFYDPSNAASSTGYTTDYKLIRTIGCPGKGLLDTPCPVPAEPVPVAAAPEPAPAALAPAAIPAAAPAPVPKMAGVNFDFDKAVVRPADFANLDQDAATLKEWGNVKVEVAGHTDSVGTEQYNMGLSERRANAVREYLISRGVAADRLTVKGYGESMPIADNTTAEGRFKNRRVELVPQQ